MPVTRNPSKKKVESKKDIKAKEAKKAKDDAQAKAAAAAELERQQAEAAAAAAAEEARLAEEKRLAEEEEEKFKRATSRYQTTDDETIKDLYRWLITIPFSRGPFGKLERDFSDGTLVAEVIGYYCPKLCNMNMYFPWYSRVNKISNWSLLNYKVFPKLGFRLNEAQIRSLTNPYGCGKYEENCYKRFIYTLLHDIKDALVELNPSVNDYKTKGFVAPKLSAKPKKFTMFKRVKADKSMPTYSKVEMMIENGFYDKKPENDQARSSEASCCSCPDLQKRYTTVEDEATIFVRPSATYCLPQPSNTLEPCYFHICQ